MWSHWLMLSCLMVVWARQAGFNISETDDHLGFSHGRVYTECWRKLKTSREEQWQFCRPKCLVNEKGLIAYGNFNNHALQPLVSRKICQKCTTHRTLRWMRQQQMTTLGSTLVGQEEESEATVGRASLTAEDWKEIRQCFFFPNSTQLQEINSFRNTQTSTSGPNNHAKITEIGQDHHFSPPFWCLMGTLTDAFD